MSRRSFIYSEDFCNGILKIIRKGKPGQFYQFASKEYLSIKEIINIIYRKYNLNPEKFIKIVSDRQGKDRDYKINDLDTRKRLNWKNNFNFENGINQTIKWYEEFKNQFKAKDEKFVISK
jgi:dTDP-glucose 4,6-dehydratase